MNQGEKLAPVAAVVSAFPTVAYCLPFGVGTARFSLVLEPLRPYLMALAGGLVAFGLWRLFRRGARRSRLSIILIWLCAAILAAMMVVPQIVADLLADL